MSESCDTCDTCKYYREDAAEVVTDFLEATMKGAEEVVADILEAIQKNAVKQYEDDLKPRFCMKYPIKIPKKPYEGCFKWKKIEKPLTPKQEASLRGQLPYGPHFKW